MGFIIWIIIGGLAGWIASMVMKNQSGLFRNIIVGIVGAFIGGWLFRLVGLSSDGSFIGSLVTATAGAVVLLYVMKLIKDR